MKRLKKYFFIMIICVSFLTPTIECSYFKKILGGKGSNVKRPIKKVVAEATALFTVTSVSMWYLRNKFKNFSLEYSDIKENISQNALFLDMLKKMVHASIDPILCDSKIPRYTSICNALEKELYKAALEPSKVEMKEKINMLISKHIDNLNQASIKYVFSELEMKKMILLNSALVFSAFFVAMGKVWYSMGVLRSLCHTSAIATGSVAGTTYLVSMYFDENRLLSVVSDFFKKNEHEILNLVTQATVEAKTIVFSELKHRNAGILLFYNDITLSESVEKYLSNVQFETLSNFLHNKEVKLAIELFTRDYFDMLYDFYNKRGIREQVKGFIPRLMIGQRTMSEEADTEEISLQQNPPLSALTVVNAYLSEEVPVECLDEDENIELIGLEGLFEMRQQRLVD